MTSKTRGKVVPTTASRRKSFKFKPNRSAAVKRTECVHLDFSSFKSVFPFPVQHERRSRADRTHTKRASTNRVRRVSWESGADSHHSKQTDSSKKSPSSENAFVEGLVRTLVNRQGAPRTEDQSSPCVQYAHEHDIIIGKKNGITKHLGNLAFRIFCWSARDEYAQAEREEKSLVVERVIQNVLSRNPPGRFLEWDEEKSFGLLDVSMKRVRTKIGSALRERKWSPPFDVFVPLGLREVLPPEHVKPTTHVVAPSVTTTTPVETKTKPAPVTVKSSQQATVSLVDPIVGPQTRVAVYWALDDVYYEGTVLERLQNCVSLHYDDGESEWIDLTKHKYRVLGTTTPSPMRPSTVSNATAISA